MGQEGESQRENAISHSHRPWPILLRELLDHRRQELGAERAAQGAEDHDAAGVDDDGLEVPVAEVADLPADVYGIGPEEADDGEKHARGRPEPRHLPGQKL